MQMLISVFREGQDGWFVFLTQCDVPSAVLIQYCSICPMRAVGTITYDNSKDVSFSFDCTQVMRENNQPRYTCPSPPLWFLCPSGKATVAQLIETWHDITKALCFFHLFHLWDARLVHLSSCVMNLSIRGWMLKCGGVGQCFSPLS